MIEIYSLCRPMYLTFNLKSIDFAYDLFIHKMIMMH